MGYPPEVYNEETLMIGRITQGVCWPGVTVVQLSASSDSTDRDKTCFPPTLAGAEAQDVSSPLRHD
jgi:hypothetical protein